ncbi:MAG: hypothetical protein ACE5Z5_06190 [Candidatus Bathyarchaeia archaeon]
MIKKELVKTQIGKEQLNVSSMAKTLVYVPRMFTKDEFKNLVGRVPEDFDRTAKELWEYVNERLKAISSRIHFVYSDSFPNDKGKSPFRGEESAIVEELVLPQDRTID